MTGHLTLTTNSSVKLVPPHAPTRRYSRSSRRDLQGRELEHGVCVRMGACRAASDIGAPGDPCRPRAMFRRNRPARGTRAGCAKQQGPGRRGLALMSLLLRMQPSPPRAVPSLVHASRGGRTGIRGHSQPEKRRTSFRAVNPQSSRASRVGAGVEPRRLLRGPIAAGRNPQARRYRWRPGTLPSAHEPHARVRALASRGGTEAIMRGTKTARISLTRDISADSKDAAAHPSYRTTVFCRRSQHRWRGAGH